MLAPETSRNPSPYPVSKGFVNYSGKIKFFVRVAEKPSSDMEFTLTAGFMEEGKTIRSQRMSVYANDRQIGEWLWDRTTPEEKTVTIPLNLLEESHRSPMNLLCLRLALSDAKTNSAQEFDLMMFEKMEFRTPIF